MSISEPDVDVDKVMTDPSLALVERMRRKQDILNRRILARQIEEADDKVRISPLCMLDKFEIASFRKCMCALVALHGIQWQRSIVLARGVPQQQQPMPTGRYAMPF